MGEYSSVLILLAISLCGVGSVIVRAKDRLHSQNKINASFTEVDVNLGELGDVNLRGLAIHDSSVWIGGSAGFVMRLKGDGQMHGQVEAAKEYEFRDVAIFDEADIVMLGSGSKARIYRYSKDSGNFTAVYENDNPASFLNCMDFWEDGKGVAFGDIIDGKILIILTDDFGLTWREAVAENIPEAVEGEVGFAASGTSLVTGEGGRAWIGLGGGPAGHKARVLMTSDYGSSWIAVETTMDAGGDTAGIFSLAAQGEKLVAVGGDFSLPGQSSRAAVSISRDGGSSWTQPDTPTYGYRSCVVFVGEDELVAVGTNGLDYSQDGGENWQNVKNVGGNKKLGWNTVAQDPMTGIFWIVGSGGKVVTMQLEY
eukprot:TRINITY_DN20404_c0_g1_i1.p1 TRINITY_DN20404_c0_g1~~TRINITY_DN20404_c0_g1_i1.p1  ORF type:complete len:376 (+),score=117.09 TRINITY_DN20404_c0_g1_i1:25-1128(+)